MEVSKRLIYYLSGQVQVHVVSVFVQSVYCIVCNLLCEQIKKRTSHIGIYCFLLILTTFCLKFQTLIVTDLSEFFNDHSVFNHS